MNTAGLSPRRVVQFHWAIPSGRLTLQRKLPQGFWRLIVVAILHIIVIPVIFGAEFLQRFDRIDKAEP